MLHKVPTANGASFYEVNGEKIMAEYRPIEPMTSLDITQPNQRAHGVLITALATNDLSNFLPGVLPAERRHVRERATARAHR